MTTQKPKFGLALMLLSASVLALYPTITLEKPQQGSALVSVKADGKAFQNQKGKASSTFSSATLTLYGSVRLKGDGALELDDLAGSLQIGLANYTITSGSGEVNKKGTIEINAKTSDASKKLELKLHGSNQGDSVTFDSKESKLSSLYFLSLTGKAIVTMPTTSTSTTWSNKDHNHNANKTGTWSDDDNHHTNKTGTVTVTQSNTITETVTQFQNQTLTVTEMSTATVTEPRNQTITETVTQTVTEPPSTATVTLTETVTSTVANSTITVTAPSTNTTLTTTQI
jgi:hypothetical protein